MAASDAFYQALIIEIDTVLDDLGTSYTVRADGIYDADMLSVNEGSTRSVVGVVADQKTTSQIAQTAVSESNLSWIGLKTLILKASANLQTKEEVFVDGQWFPLSKVVTIKPADVILAYMMDVTR